MWQSSWGHPWQAPLVGSEFPVAGPALPLVSLAWEAFGLMAVSGLQCLRSWLVHALVGRWRRRTLRECVVTMGPCTKPPAPGLGATGGGGMIAGLPACRSSPVRDLERQRLTALRRGASAPPLVRGGSVLVLTLSSFLPPSQGASAWSRCFKIRLRRDQLMGQIVAFKLTGQRNFSKATV